MDMDSSGKDCKDTQLVWLGTRQQLDKLSATELSLLSARVQFSTTVSDLGVLIDRQLSMADHVSSLCRSCFFQLRQLRLVRSSLTPDAAKMLVHHHHHHHHFVY